MSIDYIRTKKDLCRFNCRKNMYYGIITVVECVLITVLVCMAYCWLIPKDTDVLAPALLWGGWTGMCVALLVVAGIYYKSILNLSKKIFASRSEDGVMHLRLTLDGDRYELLTIATGEKSIWTAQDIKQVLAKGSLIELKLKSKVVYYFPNQEDILQLLTVA